MERSCTQRPARAEKNPIFTKSILNNFKILRIIVAAVGCALLSVTHLRGRERKWEHPSTIHSYITRDFSKLLDFLPVRLYLVRAFATYTLFHT